MSNIKKTIKNLDKVLGKEPLIKKNIPKKVVHKKNNIKEKQFKPIIKKIVWIF